MSTKGMMTGPDGDLAVAGVTVAVGDTTEQTVAAVLGSFRGEWKEFPLLGGEAAMQLGGCPDVMWPGEVKEMLRLCGVDARSVRTDGNVITVS